MKKFKSPPAPNSLWKNPLHFIAFGFGSGAMPFAPGTFGTLMAIPFYLALATLNIKMYLLLLIVIIIASIWLCDRVSKEIKIHDHQGMCIDEFVGYFVTMIAVPHSFLWIFIGFLLFRIFDIWKPWPINWIDKNISGGTGMILDDVLAGIYSCVLLHILMRIIGA